MAVCNTLLGNLFAKPVQRVWFVLCSALFANSRTATLPDTFRLGAAANIHCGCDCGAGRSGGGDEAGNAPRIENQIEVHGGCGLPFHRVLSTLKLQ